MLYHIHELPIPLKQSVRIRIAGWCFSGGKLSSPEPKKQHQSAPEKILQEAALASASPSGGTPARAWKHQPR